MTAREIIEQGLYAEAVELMDDEIREEMHNSGDYTTEQEFLEEYMTRHEQKFGKPFEV